MKITKDMLLIEAFQMGDTEKMAEILQGFGMHCLGCALSHGETVEQAAMTHGIDADKLLKALNDAIEE
ncbi:MAG: DUF1858 domain-containing protein [Bacillota bacterium]|jgi:hybrid cluster-associated redox disulfide protein|nr:DUF1858 domain-containing protein [Bacillota bacterium]HHU43815.1 DUF1858 domain-containing protein [Clostridiales bacterium]